MWRMTDCGRRESRSPLGDSRVVTLKMAVDRRKRGGFCSCSVCQEAERTSGTSRVRQVECGTPDEPYDVVRNANNECFSSRR